MTSPPLVVEVVRGDLVESRHEVHVAVWQATRGLVLSAGNPDHVAFVRSSIKMFQALPLVDCGAADRWGLTGEELALATASHGGEPFHVAAARSVLARCGAHEEQLACGPTMPMHAPSADALHRAGIVPGRIHNNCSGKHAGMIALALAEGWPLEGYHRSGHAVQQGVRDTLARWTGLPGTSFGVAVDGCGIPTFAVPLSAMAAGCARLSAAAANGDTAPSRVLGAMMQHPEYVAGTDRLCTDLMRAARGLWAKVGAEGYYCAGIPAEGLGIAVKVADGAWRAVEPALLAVLLELGALDGPARAALARYVEPPITNTRGEVVGAIRAARPAAWR
ncbi:MAG: asparaginase [Vicinamibacterales bacterium]